MHRLLKHSRAAIAALALALLPLAAHAAGTFEYTASITRPANTTTYTANTLVCASPCVASPIGLQSPGGGQVATVQLEKSSNGATGATFLVHLFRQAPTMTALADDVAYTAPFNADAANYIGNAACSTGVIGADNATFYQCTLSQTLLPYAAPGLTLYALVEATGAYVPTSGEVFKVRVTGLYDGN